MDKFQAMLGYTLMPWQEYAADLIGEIGDDGLFRRPTVVVSVPRPRPNIAIGSLTDG